MKLEHLAILVGGLYVLGRTASASSPQTGGTVPYMEEMPVNVPAPGSPAAIVQSLVSTMKAPTDLAVPHTTSTGQFTGTTTGMYDIKTAVGTLHVYPYDPRQTLSDVNALKAALYRGIAGLNYDNSNAAVQTYNEQLQALRTFSTAWVNTYRSVL